MDSPRQRLLKRNAAGSAVGSKTAETRTCSTMKPHIHRKMSLTLQKNQPLTRTGSAVPHLNRQGAAPKN
ncbi:hypothetical protein MHYP_G00238690 [Metynnis hypsauchen]